MSSPTGPSFPPAEHLDVQVRGSVPVGLSGRLLGIGRDGIVHSLVIGPGRPAWYQTQRLGTEASVRNVLEFGGTILAFGDDAPAHELSAGLDAFRAVDLAGHGRLLVPFPKRDPVTDELHLVARARDGAQSHVVVTAGALTRRDRPILDVSRRITDLALTADRVVFVAPGIVGIAPREGEARTRCFATGAPAPHPVHAHDAGDTVVLFVLTPMLERWTLHVGAGTTRREVLDPTPRRFAHASDGDAGGAPRWVWTTGDETIRGHDLVAARRTHHDLRPWVPGDFVVAADAARPDGVDGGRLIALVHGPSDTATELRVFDAADVTRPAVATVGIPRPVPPGLRCTWIPSSEH